MYGTVNLAEITVLDEKESVLMEMLADFKYYYINLGFDLSVRLSPRVVF